MYYHVYQLRKRKPWLKLCAFLKEHSVGKMIVLYCVHQIITVPPTGCLVNECVRIQLSVHFTAPDESVTVDIMLVCVGRGGWRAYSFCSQNSPFTVSDSPNPNKPSASFILWNSYTNVELHDSYIKVHWFFSWSSIGPWRHWKWSLSLWLWQFSGQVLKWAAELAYRFLEELSSLNQDVPHWNIYCHRDGCFHVSN